MRRDLSEWGCEDCGVSWDDASGLKRAFRKRTDEHGDVVFAFVCEKCAAARSAIFGEKIHPAPFGVSSRPGGGIYYPSELGQ